MLPLRASGLKDPFLIGVTSLDTGTLPLLTDRLRRANSLFKVTAVMAAHPSTLSLVHTHLFAKPGAALRPLVLQPNTWAPACASSLQPGMEWPGRDRLATPAGAPPRSF